MRIALGELLRGYGDDHHLDAPEGGPRAPRLGLMTAERQESLQSMAALHGTAPEDPGLPALAVPQVIAV